MLNAAYELKHEILAAVENKLDRQRYADLFAAFERAIFRELESAIIRRRLAAAESLIQVLELLREDQKNGPKVANHLKEKYPQIAQAISKNFPEHP